MKTNTWTWEDYDFLYKNFGELGAEKVADALKKPVETVNLKAEKMRLTTKIDFNIQEIKYARSYGSILKGSMIFLLPDRTSNEIKELIKCAKKQSTLV